MSRLSLGKEEELETKLPTFTGLSRKQGNFRKTSLCSTDYAKAFDCVNHDKLWKALTDGNTKPSYLSPEKPVCRSRSNS